MKIADIIPGGGQNRERIIAFHKELVPSNDVDVITLKGVTMRVEGMSGQQSALTPTMSAYLEAMKEAEKQGYDAIVIGTAPDPGIEEARESVHIPVVGQAMAALHVSLIIGNKVCLLVPAPVTPLWHRQRIMVYGFEDKVVYRNLHTAPNRALAAYEEYKTSGLKVTPLVDEAITQCIKAIEEDGCDVISFVTAPLWWTKEPLERELAKKGYAVSVVQGLPAAVEIARALVNLKLSQSPLAYVRKPLL